MRSCQQLTTIILVMLQGCDSRTGGSGGATFDSSVSNDDRPVEMIAAAEAHQLCEEGSAFMSDRLTLTEWEQQQCYVHAVSVDRTPADCAATFDACIARGDWDGFSWYTGFGFCGQITAPIAGCTVSVREIERCYSAWGAAIRGDFEHRRCDISGTPSAAAEFAFDSSCQAVFSTPCRSVFGAP
jgi:hypothetical protein